MCDVAQQLLPLVVREEVNIVVDVDHEAVECDEVLEVEDFVVLGGDEQEVDDGGEGDEGKEDVVGVEDDVFECEMIGCW